MITYILYAATTVKASRVEMDRALCDGRGLSKTAYVQGALVPSEIRVPMTTVIIGLDAQIALQT